MKKKNICIKALVFGLSSLAVAGPFLFHSDSAKAATNGKTATKAIAWVKSQVGKPIDYDGFAGPQCVDLIKAYYKELGVAPVTGNGSDYTHNSKPESWKRIQGAQPQKGDILVYTGGYNGYGHVAIYESDYSSYHQNWNYTQKVVHVTSKYKGDWDIKYWGVIRPDFVPEQTKPVNVTGVTLNKSAFSLAPGNSFALSATVIPNNAANKGVTWTSSNAKVASVDSSGKVTAHKTGTATITVTTSEGRKTAKATVTVKMPKDGLAKIGGKWQYYKNGVLNTGYTGLAKNSNGWWYVKRGVVDYSYTGLTRSTDGNLYYAYKGKWDTSYTGFAKSTDGSSDGKWYVVKNGRYCNTYTGLAYNRSNGGWHFARNGKYDKTYTGLAKSTDGKWYYVKNGSWAKTFSGKVQYNGKTYTIKNGKVI